jgi:hypothetical protein
MQGVQLQVAAAVFTLGRRRRKRLRASGQLETIFCRGQTCSLRKLDIRFAVAELCTRT